jgi:hypothetical protein
MKRIPLMALCALSAFAQQAPGHRVYVMPMAGGLDQHIADWLTREHVMAVVTDPGMADVVLTDRLGEAFEQKLTQIHPPKTEKTDTKNDSAGNGGGPHAAFRSTVARGTLFLVDVNTRHVLWSDHEKPPAASDASLNRAAEQIAKKLQKSLSAN